MLYINVNSRQVHKVAGNRPENLVLRGTDKLAADAGFQHLSG